MVRSRPGRSEAYAWKSEIPEDCPFASVTRGELDKINVRKRTALPRSKVRPRGPHAPFRLGNRTNWGRLFADDEGKRVPTEGRTPDEGKAPDERGTPDE